MQVIRQIGLAIPIGYYSFESQMARLSNVVAEFASPPAAVGAPLAPQPALNTRQLLWHGFGCWRAALIFLRTGV